MANTTTTSADDLLYAAIIEESVIEELRAINVMPKTFRQKSMVGVPSKAADFPTWPTETAAALTEGTDITGSAISTAKKTITCGEVGLMTTVTDVLEKSDILNGLGEYSPVLARAVKTKVDADCAALLQVTDGGTGIESSGNPLTYTLFLQALTKMELANAHTAGKIIGVLHTQQASDLRTDLGITLSNPQLQNIDPHGEMYSNRAGYFGTLNDVDIFADNNVPTVNTAADRAGGLYVKGYTFGLATKWALRVELQRNASLRATEIVVTTNYGVGELVDAAGCPIVTDA